VAGVERLLEERPTAEDWREIALAIWSLRPPGRRLAEAAEQVERGAW